MVIGRVNVQETQAEHNTDCKLLFGWRLKTKNHSDRHGIGDQVSQDIQRRIR